jgi:hypothetical protein
MLCIARLKRVGFVDGFQKLLKKIIACVVKHPAGRRELNLAFPTYKKQHAQRIFQRRNSFAHYRLRYVHQFGSLGKAACSGHRGKSLDLTKIDAG